MILVEGKPIGVPGPSSPGVSYTLWRMNLEKLHVPTGSVSAIISKVASYAEAPSSVFCIGFDSWSELYTAAAKGIFATPLPSVSVSIMPPTTTVSLPTRANVQNVVLALIDHPTVVYKGQPLVSEDIAIAIGRDPDVPRDTKLRASAQWGERDQAQDFFDDVVPGVSKRCIFVDNYEPNTDGQRDKIRTALATIAVTGTLFIIGHCDGEAGRIANLAGDTLAGLCNQALAGAQSIVLWGCHTAGQASSSGTAAMLGGASAMSAFHGGLTVSRQVQGFTCYVNTGGMNGARLRFTTDDGYTDATWSAVDHRFASALGHACKHLAP